MLSPDPIKLAALCAILEHSGTVAQQPDEVQRTLSPMQREQIRVEVCQQASAISARWCPEQNIRTNFNPDGNVIVPGISPTA